MSDTMLDVIVPKSDQINADDLLGRSMTIKISDVKIAGGQEQPVSIMFEGSKKAFRPCKSMSRVLVHGWGADAKQYVGRSLTLYCDPHVKWGGLEVGGVRISHMSDLDSAMVMQLTATKGQRKPHKVMPLVAAKPAPEWTPYDAMKEVADLQTEPDARTMWKRAMALSKVDAESWKPVLDAITARVAAIKAPVQGVDTVAE